jgi:outer membrane protein assembly factor BamB
MPAAVSPSTVIDIVYADPSTSLDGRIVATDRVTGERRWTWAFPTPPDNWYDYSAGQPVLVGDTLFVAMAYSSAEPSLLFAIDTRTGRVAWRSSTRCALMGERNAGLTWASGHLFVPTRCGLEAYRPTA